MVTVAPALLPTVPRFGCVGGCNSRPREACASLNDLVGPVERKSVPWLWRVVKVVAGSCLDCGALAEKVKNWVLRVTFRFSCRVVDAVVANRFDPIVVARGLFVSRGAY